MIDLQKAVKLYRRQGVVSAQNRHLQRSMVSELYPMHLKATTANVHSPDLSFAFKEIILPVFNPSGSAMHEVNCRIVRKDTTVITTIPDIVDSAAVAEMYVKITRKNTTVKVDLPPYTDACGEPSFNVNVKLSTPAIDVTQNMSADVRGQTLSIRRD